MVSGSAACMQFPQVFMLGNAVIEIWCSPRFYSGRWNSWDRTESLKTRRYIDMRSKSLLALTHVNWWILWLIQQQQHVHHAHRPKQSHLADVDGGRAGTDNAARSPDTSASHDWLWLASIDALFVKSGVGRAHIVTAVWAVLLPRTTRSTARWPVGDLLPEELQFRSQLARCETKVVSWDVPATSSVLYLRQKNKEQHFIFYLPFTDQPSSIALFTQKLGEALLIVTDWKWRTFTVTTCKLIVWERGYGQGSRPRPWLCRWMSTLLVRYRDGPEKFLEHSFLRIRRRSNANDLSENLLRFQGTFVLRRRQIFSTGNDGASPAMGTPSIEWPVLLLCRVLRSSKPVSVFIYFLILLSRRFSLTKPCKNAAKTKRSNLPCAVLPVWCVGRIIAESVTPVPTTQSLLEWSPDPQQSLALHTVTCLFRLQSRKFAFFSFSVTLQFL